MQSTLKDFRQALFPAHKMLDGGPGLLGNVGTHSYTEVISYFQRMLGQLCHTRQFFSLLTKILQLFDQRDHRLSV